LTRSAENLPELWNICWRPPATGHRDSLFPPENAAGNYVKVVQRLPVRIRFDLNQDGLD